MAADPKLTLKFNNKQPIDVLDLTNSSNALVRQYQKYAVTFDDVSSRSDARLYVQDLRKGSVIADLIPYAQEIGAAVRGVAPYAEDAKKVIGFAKYLKLGMDGLLGGKKPPEPVTTKYLKDFKQILEPAAKEHGATFLFQANDGAVQNVSVTITSQDANVIQRQAERQIELMKEPEQKRFNKRLMYWDSAKKGKPSKSSDKAVIETISPKSLPVFIDDPDVKEQMLAGKGNPFLIGFIVDVELLMVRGEVRGYSILHVHGTLEDEESEGVEDEENDE